MKWKITIGFVLLSLNSLFAQTNERFTFAVFQPIGANDTVLVAAGQVMAGEGEESVDHGYYPLLSTLLSTETMSDSSFSFTAYPNPFQNYIQLELNFSEQNYRIVVTNSTGANVSIVNLKNGTDFISTEHLAPGLYTITIYSAEGVWLTSKKMIRQ
jgi:hypothetical protein